MKFSLLPLLCGLCLALPAVAQDRPDAGAAGGSAPAGRTEEGFEARVKTLEEQVSELKEKVYRSKARLLLLQETVLGGEISQGAQARIFHRNEMGSTYVLESVAYALDGSPVFTKVDQDGDLDGREEFEVFQGRIVPGQHQLAVRITYRGNGHGLFSYLDGYKFKVQSSYAFDAQPGKVTTVKVVGYEKGGMTSDLKDRPGIRYEVEAQKEPAAKLKGESAVAPSP